MPGGAGWCSSAEPRRRRRSSARTRCRTTCRGRDLGRRAGGRGRRRHGRGRPSRCAPARTATAARPGAAARCTSPAGRWRDERRSCPFDDLLAEEAGAAPAARREPTPAEVAAPLRAAATSPRPSRPRWSPRRSTARWSSSPAPVRARPRRWPPGCAGWSPTAGSAPRQVLGLTFTRKAAGELNARVRVRLAALARHPDTDPAAGERLAVAHADRRHLPRLRRLAGRRARAAARRRAGRRLLGPAMCWRQAAAAVAACDRRPRATCRSSPVTTIDDVLALAGELGEHDVAPDAAARLDGVGCEARIAGYAARQGQARGRTPRSQKVIERQRARVALLPLVEAFERGSGRSAPSTTPTRWPTRPGSPPAPPRSAGRAGPLAGGAARRVPGHQRRRSCACSTALFGGATGHPVLAVGDPRQSIYGWRGASAGDARALPARPSRRARPRGAAAHAGHQLAQRRAHPRRRQRGVRHAAAAAAAAARPAPAPGAGRGAVTVGLYDTVAEETGGARRPAGRLLARHDPALPARDGRPPTIAVLARARKQFHGIATALRERGVPVEVVGLGGLLATPEVRRRRRHAAGAGRPHGRRRARPAAHRRPVAARARATWPRWSRRARRAGARPAGPATRAPRSPTPSAAAWSRRWTTSATPRAYSAGGLPPAAAAARRAGRAAPPARRAAARPGRRGRPDPRPGDRAGQRARRRARPAPAPTSTRCTTVAARVHRAGRAARRCRPSSATSRDADERERGLEPGEVAVNPEAVSCSPCTRRRAWSGTSSPCPGLTRDQFPAKPTAATPGSATPARCPSTCAPPTAAELPALRAPDPAAGDQQDVEHARKDYIEAWKDFGTDEELRLGYVAVTRARHLLAVLRQLVARRQEAARAVVACCSPPRTPARTAPARSCTGRPRPRTARATRRWRSGRSASGRPTRSSPAGAARSPPPPSWSARPSRTRSTWSRLAATRRRWSSSGRATPTCCCASGPRHASPTRRRRRCPRTCRSRRWSRCAATRPSWPGGCAVRCPRRPAPLARRGTAFHAWLEERFGSARLLDLDELPGAGDERRRARRRRSTELQEAFLASEWADRQPVRSRCRSRRVVGRLVAARPDRRRLRRPPTAAGRWSTGRPARRPRRRAAAVGVQLAAYRLGWSRLTGVPVERVSAGVPPRGRRRDPAAGRPAGRGRPARPGHRHRGLRPHRRPTPACRAASSGRVGSAPQVLTPSEISALLTVQLTDGLAVRPHGSERRGYTMSPHSTGRCP